MISIREDAAALLQATKPNLASAATDRNTPFAVSGKLAGVGFTLVMVAGLAARCSPLEADVLQDVGNMAYPQPLAQGIVSTTAVFGRQSRDTGSMAYPAPRPEGNAATTYFR